MVDNLEIIADKQHSAEMDEVRMEPMGNYKEGAHFRPVLDAFSTNYLNPPKVKN